MKTKVTSICCHHLFETEAWRRCPSICNTIMMMMMVVVMMVMMVGSISMPSICNTCPKDEHKICP